MSAEDSSFINYKNQDEEISYWFVVLSRCWASRSQNKVLWSLLHCVASTTPTHGQFHQDPRHIESERKSLSITCPDHVDSLPTVFLCKLLLYLLRPFVLKAVKK